MRATQLKDRSVLSVNDGARLGVVRDVLFDVGAARVAALTVDHDRRTALIPFLAVQGVGDAVTVDSRDVALEIKDRGARVGLRSLGDLVGMSVVDTGGALLGRVEDIEIGPQGAQMTAIGVHHGGVLGIGGSTRWVPVQAVRSLGPDAVIVDAEAARAE